MAKKTTPAATEAIATEATEATDATEATEGGNAQIDEGMPAATNLTAYERAVAFQPDPWDQLPEDPEVRRIYLDLNGHLSSFIKRRK